MDTLFIVLQHLLPQHLLSRVTGWLAETRIAWLKTLLIRMFAKHFQVDMSEAAEPVLEAYPNFNAFFTRALMEGARPIDPVQSNLVCPADGAISQIGRIEHGRIFQAKGHRYSAAELLADPQRGEQYANGHFATIYLSPKDYHRVHMPLAGELVAEAYVPGDLYSVNQVTAENVERLFARNERHVCHFETEAGPMAVVLVGAMIVAGIETAWGGQMAPPPKGPCTIDYRRLPDPVSLDKGAEMGRFKLGSTVILLFPEDSISWEDAYRANSPTRMGEALGRINR